MKQETLEEAALRRYQYTSVNPPYTIITPKYKIQGFIDGAKWQAERMYSEEDLLSAFEAGMMFIGEDKGSFREWFEQLKKSKGGEQ